MQIVGGQNITCAIPGIREYLTSMNTGRGSAGNVIAALCSFFFPGLGQLTQGRILSALLFFLGAIVVWFISLGTLGWLVHLWACIEAALWRSKGSS